MSKEKAVGLLKWVTEHLIQFGISILVALTTMVIAKYFNASDMSAGFYSGASFVFILENIYGKIKI